MNTDVSVITVPHDASVLRTLKAIDQGGLGIAFVQRDQRFHGVLTDGDVRRALIRGVALDESITDFVNTSPTVMTPAESRDAALELLQARGFTSVPIVEDGTAVGVHTLRTVLGREARSNPVVIMAGGKGTRLGELTKDYPKPMLPVAGRPILERIVHHLVGCGFTDISLAVNFKSSIIESHFGDGHDFGCNIRYIHERSDEPLGTAGSLRRVIVDRPTLSSSVLVLNGDILTQAPLDEAVGRHESTGADITVGVTAHEYRVPFGVVNVSGDRVGDIAEKPLERWLVGAGVNVLSPRVLREIPHGYFDMTDLYDVALANKLDVRVHSLDGSWIDVGRPADLATARGE